MLDKNTGLDGRKTRGHESGEERRREKTDETGKRKHQKEERGDRSKETRERGQEREETSKKEETEEGTGEHTVSHLFLCVHP